MAATATQERLISSDDHVDVSHDDVKARLATKYHDSYDAGVARFQTAMTGMLTASSTDGNSSVVAIGPVCPPPSPP